MIVYVISFQADHRVSAKWRRRWSRPTGGADGARAYRIMSSAVLGRSRCPIGRTYGVPGSLHGPIPIAIYGVPIVGRGGVGGQAYVLYYYPGEPDELAGVFRRSW